jgi:hypothetical protein
MASEIKIFWIARVVGVGEAIGVACGVGVEDGRVVGVAIGVGAAVGRVIHDSLLELNFPSDAEAVPQFSPSGIREKDKAPPGPDEYEYESIRCAEPDVGGAVESNNRAASAEDLFQLNSEESTKHEWGKMRVLLGTV